MTEQNIIAFLEKQSALDEKSAIKPLLIAKEIFGPAASCKSINPHLYALERKGKTRVVYRNPENKSDPVWFLIKDKKNE